MQKELTLEELIFKYKVILKSLLKNWVLILAFSISLGILGLLLAYVKGDKYTAKITFIFENMQNDLLSNYSKIASQFGMALGQGGGGVFDKENIIELIKSKKIIYRALLSETTIGKNRIKIVDYYIDSQKYRETWKDELKLKNIDFSKNNSSDSLQKDSLLNAFYTKITKKYLSITKVGNFSSIIELKVETKNEILSKILSEAILNSILDFYKFEMTTSSSKNISFLEQRTDSVKNALLIYENELASWEDSNLGLVKKEGFLKKRKLIRDIEILNIMYAELIKNLEISQISFANQQPVIQIIDTPKYPLDKSYISAPIAFIVGLFLGLFFSILFFTIKTILFYNIKQD
ncbi:MAG: hypothetical protein A2X12_10180 [Bacteroidetes bacterium GWE2_29_8]|nr:MAG: hypothetical protein A2X12_10180 [Bacteroidetes bacterium GWE2_29_8]OFY18992.1 MAG: hypothetical protein A2X02_03365 [Bacteroidetes bacterium GWF2_29_10]